MYLDKFKSSFGELSHLFPRKLVPCTKEQIYFLERRFGLTLPMGYKEFLLWGGIRAGGLFRDSNCFYDSLPELRKGAEELLERDEFPELLPEDAFVFFMHQGYIFWFFKIGFYGIRQGNLDGVRIR